MTYSRLRIIVTGLIAEYPLGGMTWHYLQYVLGLSRMGHDVFYFEDSGGWPYDPRREGLGVDCDFNVRYLAGVMSRFGMADRWAYRLKKKKESDWFGLPTVRRREVVGSADMVLNISGTLHAPDDYRAAGRLIYLDTDPVFTQLRLLRGDAPFAERADAHDVHFTFGERVARNLPDTGHRWLPTRQPIVLDEWCTDRTPRAVYSTVMNWTSYESESYEGETYGQKDVEFGRFLDLPERLPAIDFEIAGAPGHGDPTPRETLVQKGWRLVDPMEVCPDLDSYRSYIQTSKGEWSVAKNGYVKGCSGWFSERSACYLAAGRPVVVQDTSFPEALPVGEGIVPFKTPDEAVDAVRAVEAAYPRHAGAAREIACACFGADVVLSSLLREAEG